MKIIVIQIMQILKNVKTKIFLHQETRYKELVFLALSGIGIL